MDDEYGGDYIDFSDSDSSSSYDILDDSGYTGGVQFPIAGLGSLVGTGGPAASTYGASFQPTAGAFPALGGAAGAAMAGVMSLGARLAGMFGRGAGTFVINGVKGSMSRLWPYIRQYGPGAVAAALGITVAQLGALAMNAPQSPRKRRRGISAADIRRTKRVIRFNRQLSRQLGTGRRSSSYRPRRRYAYC